MLYRKKFITNSSSTGFVAWGVIVPKSMFPTIPEQVGGIIVEYVSDTKRFVGIGESLKVLWSEDGDDVIIEDGVYPIEGNKVVCEATIQPRLKKPVDGSGGYNEWERKIASFLKERGSFDLATYLPRWLFVRVRQ